MLAFSNDYYGMIFRATQSVELFCAYIRTAMDNSTTTVEVEEAMWPDNEDELTRLFGLR